MPFPCTGVSILRKNALIPLTGADSNPEALGDALPAPVFSSVAILPFEDQFAIATRKVMVSTCNPHQIYNFLSYHRYLHHITLLSPQFLLFLFLPIFVMHFLIPGGVRQWLKK